MRVISVIDSNQIQHTNVPKFYTALSEDTFKGKLKSHWNNGVKMLSEYGVNSFTGQKCTVTGCCSKVDINLLFEEYENCPNNTILFLQSKKNAPKKWQNPFPDFNYFVCEYSTFMKFTSFWKKLNDYEKHSNTMNLDDINAYFNSILFEHKLNYRILQ